MNGAVRVAVDRLWVRGWGTAVCRGALARVVAISSCLALLGASAGSARAAESPIGAHSMLQLSSPYPFMQSMFEEAAAMHASAIRLDVAPALVFHDPLQPPDFTGLDEVVSLANAYHLRVVADLTTIPWWISACATPRDISQMTLCGTDDLADYRAEITEIVRRADPAIHDWEIWNEPDLGSFFSGTPLQYAWMLRTAHDAIKAIDPQADVLLGGISGLSGENLLAQVFAAAGPDACTHSTSPTSTSATDSTCWLQTSRRGGGSSPPTASPARYGSPSTGTRPIRPSSTTRRTRVAAVRKWHS